MKLDKFSCLALTLILGELICTPVRAQTWTRTSVAGSQFASITLSPDGNKLVVANEEALFVSTNFGNTWAKVSSGVLGIFFPVTSADGSKWLGYDSSLGLHLSTNSAASWTSIEMAMASGIGISADGGILISVLPKQIAVSTNWGASEERISLPGGLSREFKTAANGSQWFVFDTGTPFLLYTATDWGSTWTTNNLPSTNLLTSLAVSADGKRIIAAEQCQIPTSSSVLELPGAIYISGDSGASWFQSTAPSNYWTSVASSADGTVLVTNPPTLDFTNLQYEVALPAPAGTAFFRLSTP